MCTTTPRSVKAQIRPSARPSLGRSSLAPVDAIVCCCRHSQSPASFLVRRPADGGCGLSLLFLLLFPLYTFLLPLSRGVSGAGEAGRSFLACGERDSTNKKASWRTGLKREIEASHYLFEKDKDHLIALIIGRIPPLFPCARSRDRRRRRPDLASGKRGRRLRLYSVGV